MTHRVGVIGAGLSGLMAARTLQLAGLEVVAFDKGRRAGGRANTREHSDYRFDHGAQFFTVRDEALGPHLQGWQREGLVQEWGGRLVRIEGETMSPAKAAIQGRMTREQIAEAQRMSREWLEAHPPGGN